MAKFEDVYRKMVQEQAQPEAVEETAETIVEEVEEAVIKEVKKESKAKEEFPPKKDDEEDDEDEKKKKNGAVAKEKVETKESTIAIPKTKNGILKAVYGKMEGIKKEHLAQAYNAILASFDKIKAEGTDADTKKKVD